MKTKNKKVTKNVVEYYDICKLCKKPIKGRSKKHVEYNMGLHIGKHERDNRK